MRLHNTSNNLRISTSEVSCHINKRQPQTLSRNFKPNNFYLKGLNKKAQLGDQLTFFPYLLMLIIIATGIGIGIYMFFGAEYDFREIDSSSLNYQIQKCFSEKEIDFSLNTKDFKQELFTKCPLNQQVIENNFIVQIKHDGIQKYKQGDIKRCELGDKSKDAPICTSTQQDNLFILTGSKQHSQKKRT